MATRRAVLSAIAGLLAVAACGPGEPEGPASSLSFDVRLPPGDVTITSLQLTVLDAAASCDPPDASGGSALLVEPIELGVPKTIQVSAGQRTFSVVAYDGSSAVARGCDRLNLVAGETHTVSIDLVEYPEDIDAGVPDGGAPDAGVPDASTGPEGDDCDTAITLSPGTLYNQLLSADFTDQQSGSCGGDGRDRVYTFTTFTERQVEIETTGNLEHVLYVRAADCSSGAEAGCSVSAGAGTYTASFRQLNLPANTYFVFVDASIAGQTGQFQITLTLSDPVPDVCSMAEELSLNGTTLGTLVNAGNDYTGNCGGTGPDAVYTFTLSEVSRIRATVTRTSGSFDPVIYLRGDCETQASEPIGGCADESTGAVEQLDIDYLGAGTHFLFVDSASGGTGAFELFVEVLPAPPLNDRCPGAISMTEGVTVSGTTADARDDTSGDCTPGTLDVFYELTLSEPRHVTIDLTNATTEHALYVQGTCGESATQLACASTAAADEQIDLAYLDAGTYTVVVEAESGGAGTFDLVYNTTTPTPIGDTCAEAVLMSHNETLAGEALSSTYADDNTGSCGGSGNADRVYDFVLSGDQQVTIETTNASFEHVLYVRSADCAAGAEEGCTQATDVGGGIYEATLSFGSLPAGVYYVWLDATAAVSDETFDITLTVSGAVNPPINDECAGASSLVEGLTTPGTLDAATNDEAASCVTGSQGDVFYRAVLTEPRRVVINLLSGDNTAMTVLSGSCGSLTELFCIDDTSMGELLDIGYLAAGTYYIMVEGVAGATGSFNIGYTTSSPRPDNDQCWGAETLQSGVWLSGETTANGLDDATGSCGGSGSADVVYELTIPPGTDRRARITVQAASAFDPVIYMRADDCETGAEVECAQHQSGADEVLDIPSLAPGTYFIWVDASSSGSGTFDIVAEILDEVAPPTYDTCSSPDPLEESVPEGPFSTVGAADDYDLTCVASDGRDTVHSLTLDSAAALLVTIAPEEPLWNLVASLRQDCAGGPDLSCVATGFDPRYINMPDLAADTYEIIVDGDSGTTGDYTITYDTGPQDTTFGYWILESTGTYESIAGTTGANEQIIPVTTQADWDDGSTGAGDEWAQTLALPFSFPFYGMDRTSLSVNSNMFMTFGSPPADAYDNDCPLDSTEPTDTIALFWDDGVTFDGVSELWTKTEGSAPNRKFIIEFKDWWMLYCDPPPPQWECYMLEVYANQQAVLYENGDIEFRYGSRVAPGTTYDCDTQQTGCSATIGIEGTSTPDVDGVQCDTDGVTDGRVIHFVYPTN